MSSITNVDSNALLTRFATCMTPRTRYLLPLLLLTGSLFFVSCSDDTSDSTSPSASEPSFRKDGTLTFVQSDGTPVRTIDVEIAETDAARARGLMHRRSLGYDRGMLFIMEETSRTGFWMKNTPLPLDIMFLDPDSSIINIVENTTPFSTKNIKPEAPKRYVVEVRAGFSNRFNIEPGMTVQWTRTSDPSPAS